MIAKRNWGRRSRGNNEAQKNVKNHALNKKDVGRIHAKFKEGSRYSALTIKDSNLDPGGQKELEGQIKKDIKMGDVKAHFIEEKAQNIEVVPETQLIPPQQNPKEGPNNQAGQQAQKVEKIRNPKAGKNSQSGRNKDIKVIANKSFKKNLASSAKPLGKLEEVISKELKVDRRKATKEEEMAILDRVRQIQIQQQDTAQACEGWSGMIQGTNVFVNPEASAYVQSLKNYVG